MRCPGSLPGFLRRTVAPEDDRRHGRGRALVQRVPKQFQRAPWPDRNASAGQGKSTAAHTRSLDSGFVSATHECLSGCAPRRTDPLICGHACRICPVFVRGFLPQAGAEPGEGPVFPSAFGSKRPLFRRPRKRWGVTELSYDLYAKFRKVSTFRPRAASVFRMFPLHYHFLSGATLAAATIPPQKTGSGT